MAKFELVKRFEGENDLLPKRGTSQSAGYDLIVAEDTVIPPYEDLTEILTYSADLINFDPNREREIEFLGCKITEYSYTLSEVAKITKETSAKPTLVSTGVKCKLNPDEYLEISARSSTPLKYWLIVANAPGIVDADYYNNPDNEGEIFVQLINLFPNTIMLQKGDKVGQAIIKKYCITEDDEASGLRVGGFGSTGQ